MQILGMATILKGIYFSSLSILLIPLLLVGQILSVISGSAIE